MTDYIHEFDPSASNPDNLVVGEIHNLADATARVIVPTNGLIYSRSLIVKKVSNNAVLVLNTDYTFQGFDAEITALTGYECICGIEFINEALNGQVELSYQTVGGAEGSLSALVNDLRRRIALINSQYVTWDQIINKPTEFPIEDHTHDLLTDLTNFGALRAALERIIAALANARAPVLSGTSLSLRIDKLLNLISNQRRDFNILAAQRRMPYTRYYITGDITLTNPVGENVYLLNITGETTVHLPMVSSLDTPVKLTFINYKPFGTALVTETDNVIQYGTATTTVYEIGPGETVTLVNGIVDHWFKY